MKPIKLSRRDSSILNLQKAIASRVNNSRLVKNCSGCGKSCSIVKAQVKKGWKYCSWECRVKNMKGENGPNSGGGQWMTGENNFNYKHGQSSNREPRDLKLVNRWRRRIYARDEYVCQMCGYDKGKTLRAHHIYSWSNFPELRFELDNGISLCDPCHIWVHSKQNTESLFICN